MLLIRYLVPGGGGGIKRREHARKTCSSPLLMLMITGCTALVKALTYLRASAFISSGSGKSGNSRSSSGLASLTYAHLQFKGEPSNLLAESHFPEKHGQFCPRITIFEIFLKLNPMNIKLVKIASKYKMNKNLSNDTQNVGLQEYLGLYKIFLKKF